MVDVTIIGGGPGGYAAARRARDYGFQTLLIEKGKIGGVCLHRGCIPTKSLIADALAERSFSESHLKKEKVISRLYAGMTATLEKEGVSTMQGEAQVAREHVVRVGHREIETKFILIATGSRPKELTGIPFDDHRFLSSDGLLSLKEVPKSLWIIGAGPTGCEFASLFQKLGTQVTLVEAMPQILPESDAEIAESLRKIFTRQGIAVQVNKKINAPGETDQAEKILISIGRLPNTEGLGLEKWGVLSPCGTIEVDPFMRTKVPSIYAVGDVTGKSLLAHAASAQAELAVDHMHGEKINPGENAIPECVYTRPEVAEVGLTEQEAREKGIECLIGRASFIASAKAQILGEKEGLVKLIGEAKSGKLLGAHLLGAQVTELIGELTLALNQEISVLDIARTIHPHPTLSESIREAAWDFVRQKSGGRRYRAFSDMAPKAD